jgi:hypothetical protein
MIAAIGCELVIESAIECYWLLNLAKVAIFGCIVHLMVPRQAKIGKEPDSSDLILYFRLNIFSLSLSLPLYSKYVQILHTLAQTTTLGQRPFKAFPTHSSLVIKSY